MSLKYLSLTGLSRVITNLKNWVVSQIPTKTSEITNDSGFITSSSLPTVNNATLTIQKNGTNVQTFTANASSNKTANITVPTKTSEITNDSGYLSNSLTNNTSRGALGWSSSIGTNLPTMNTIAYWNGAYTNTSSNLAYCVKGAFGDIVTHNASEFLTAHQTVSNSAPTLAWGTTSTIGTVGGTALTVKMPANPNTTYSAGTGLSLSGTTFSVTSTAGTSTLAWNSEVTLGTVGGLAIKAKLPANPNTDTDTKVTQTVTPANSWYPVLLGNTADATATETSGARFAKGARINARYGQLALNNTYDSNCLIGGTGTEYVAARINFGDYSKHNAADMRCYRYSSGRVGFIFRVYNRLTDGAYATDGTEVSGFFRLNYDTSGKYIDTDLTWASNLTPLTNNSKTLGTSSLYWKAAYATTFYGTLDGNATNVTGTVTIAHGGTGATTRLDAVKALTNEKVGTDTDYFLTITSSWGKAGYCSVADAKTVLGLQSGAYAEAYVHPTTAGNKHIPSGGSSGQYLKYSSSGTAVWADLPSGAVSSVLSYSYSNEHHTAPIAQKATVVQSKLAVVTVDVTDPVNLCQVTCSNIFLIALHMLVGTNSYKQDSVNYGGILQQTSKTRSRLVALIYPYSTSITFTISFTTYNQSTSNSFSLHVYQ